MEGWRGVMYNLYVTLPEENKIRLISCGIMKC